MACIVYFVGKPESEFDSTKIGYIAADGAAAKSGLQVGDDILKVDGHPVKHFQSGTDSVKWRIVRSEGETIPFEVKRGDQVLTINSGWTKPDTASWRRPALRQVGIGPRFILERRICRAWKTRRRSRTSGRRPHPHGQRNVHFQYRRNRALAVDDNPGGSLNLGVERNGQTVPLVPQRSLPPARRRPAKSRPRHQLGPRHILSHPAPWTQVSDAATSIFRMVDALLSPKSDVKAAHFSGPVGIMKMYYQVFESDYGWRLALSLSVLINVNLALLNLLPFPVLDGGHIMLAIIEGIRRKPISIRVLEVVQTACAILLIGFMLYVTFYDVGDFVPQDKKAATEEKK